MNHIWVQESSHRSQSVLEHGGAVRGFLLGLTLSELEKLKYRKTLSLSRIGTYLSEGGSNLSVGQRQLVCLGKTPAPRASIRSSVVW